MITKLIVATGKSAGRSISIKRNKLLIGRAEECDVRPLSEDVSRRHCAVHVGPADVWVEDLGSRNGTFVNGVRIAAKTKVASGDLIRVGALELTVSCSEPAATGGDQDVSKWLMADESPAGMFDTTRSLSMPADSTLDDSGVVRQPTAEPVKLAAEVVGSADGGGAPGTTMVGMAVAGAAQPAQQATAGVAAAPAAVVEAAAKNTPAPPAKEPQPGPAPKGGKNAAVNSRDAAAEALKKFFNNR